MNVRRVLAPAEFAGPGDPDTQRALRCLVNLQQHGTGRGRPHQAAGGISFQAAVLDYRLYKDIFPAWPSRPHLQGPSDLIPCS